ncbi:hypothetical protein [Thermomonas sp.]|uniref:hypothetical protein n=1 Tax=Thermomonas sp. TaxID=1971895 RepID=UPI00391C8D9B
MPKPSAPRWYALPLLVLGAAGFAAFWMLAALALDGLCAWLAPLAAVDMLLLLRIAKWPAGPARAAWAALATAGVVAAANFLIVAGQVGQNFGLRPWESALLLGRDYAWLLLRLTADRLDIALWTAGVLVALWAGLSGRRPAPSAR